MKGDGLTLWGRLRARRLQNTVWVLLTFISLFVIFLILHSSASTSIQKEIYAAMYTSLLAAIFITSFELYTKYKDFSNAEFIENLYGFGIHNLHFDKEAILESLIPNAKKSLWISGYRLILTRDLEKPIAEAFSRGVKVRVLTCPPGNEAFQLVYTDEMRAIDNYISVMRALLAVADTAEPQTGKASLEFRFAETPLFSDTYRVDQQIITGPFMHNVDLVSGTMTAHDFFTFWARKGYRLFDIMKDDYVAVWQSSPKRMMLEDVERYIAVLDELDEATLSPIQKVELLHEAMKDTRE